MSPVCALVQCMHECCLCISAVCACAVLDAMCAWVQHVHGCA
jgi:hypothetical protein